jgi:hypothetical protein
MASLLDFDDEASITKNPANPNQHTQNNPSQRDQVEIQRKEQLPQQTISESVQFKRILVPHRAVNGGIDIKFEEDAFNVRLHGIMSSEDYSRTIGCLNKELKKCRATNFDHTLLVMGPTLLPLIPWAIRNKQHKIQRRQIMTKYVNDFNRTYTELSMRWQIRPSKQLIIMRSEDAERELNN